MIALEAAEKAATDEADAGAAAAPAAAASGDGAPPNGGPAGEAEGESVTLRDLEAQLLDWDYDLEIIRARQCSIFGPRKGPCCHQ